MVATDNAIYVSDKAKAKVVKLMEDADRKSTRLNSSH